MARIAHNGMTSQMTGREHIMKKPFAGKQGDEIFSFVTNLSKDSHQLFDDLSASLPKVGKFLKKNWKPIVAVATLGAATYAIVRQAKAAPRRALIVPKVKKGRSRR